VIVVFRGALTGISHAQSVFLPAPSDSRVCSSITKQLRHITTKIVTDLVCHIMTDQAPRATSSATATTAPLSTTVIVHPARVCVWIAAMYHTAASMPPNTNWIDTPDGPDC